MNWMNNYLFQRRVRRYQQLVARIRRLRTALTGIDYTLHPVEWTEIELNINRLVIRADRQFDRLNLNPDLRLH